ncbi:hypothetical protein SNEBB_007243 [Seison nebaliae]|nr:hypothetical protein SNEBB_007243 [Seison nebaliae]
MQILFVAKLLECQTLRTSSSKIQYLSPNILQKLLELKKIDVNNQKREIHNTFSDLLTLSVNQHNDPITNDSPIRNILSMDDWEEKYITQPHSSSDEIFLSPEEESELKDGLTDNVRKNFYEAQQFPLFQPKKKQQYKFDMTETIFDIYQNQSNVNQELLLNVNDETLTSLSSNNNQVKMAMKDVYEKEPGKKVGDIKFYQPKVSSAYPNSLTIDVQNNNKHAKPYQQMAINQFNKSPIVKQSNQKPLVLGKQAISTKMVLTTSGQKQPPKSVYNYKKVNKKGKRIRIIRRKVLLELKLKDAIKKYWEIFDKLSKAPDEKISQILLNTTKLLKAIEELLEKKNFQIIQLKNEIKETKMINRQLRQAVLIEEQQHHNQEIKYKTAQRRRQELNQKLLRLQLKNKSLKKSSTQITKNLGEINTITEVRKPEVSLKSMNYSAVIEKEFYLNEIEIIEKKIRYKRSEYENIERAFYEFQSSLSKDVIDNPEKALKYRTSEVDQLELIIKARRQDVFATDEDRIKTMARLNNMEKQLRDLKKEQESMAKLTYLEQQEVDLLNKEIKELSDGIISNTLISTNFDGEIKANAKIIDDILEDYGNKLAEYNLMEPQQRDLLEQLQKKVFDALEIKSTTGNNQDTFSSIFNYLKKIFKFQVESAGKIILGQFNSAKDVTLARYALENEKIYLEALLREQNEIFVKKDFELLKSVYGESLLYPSNFMEMLNRTEQMYAIISQTLPSSVVEENVKTLNEQTLNETIKKMKEHTEYKKAYMSSLLKAHEENSNYTNVYCKRLLKSIPSDTALEPQNFTLFDSNTYDLTAGTYDHSQEKIVGEEGHLYTQKLRGVDPKKLGGSVIGKFVVASDLMKYEIGEEMYRGIGDYYLSTCDEGIEAEEDSEKKLLSHINSHEMLPQLVAYYRLKIDSCDRLHNVLFPVIMDFEELSESYVVGWHALCVSHYILDSLNNQMQGIYGYSRYSI